MSLHCRSIRWILLALFSGASFVGQGFHLLPGCGHDHGVACAHGPEHHDDRGPAEHEHDGFTAADHGSVDADHCTICGFYTQAKLAAAGDDFDAIRGVVPALSAEAPLFWPTSELRLAQPRGPPTC